MIPEQRPEIPSPWERLELNGLKEVVLIVGATDVGKTTFARYLYEAISAEALGSAAYLDGDPGQSILGPPATLTLALGQKDSPAFPPTGRLFRYFIGSTTPRGHLLPALVGANRLVQAGRETGAGTIIYDTSGLIDPTQGGLALKSAEIDLLAPSVVFAIQHEQELEPLLKPLRRSRRVKVIDLHPAEQARRRSALDRRLHRAAQFASHFSGASAREIDWTQLPIFPYPSFRLNRLVALEDLHGFTLSLGIILQIDRPNRSLTLLTPLDSFDKVNALRMGDLLLDPRTFQDEIISSTQ
ncbi:MAG TPA: polynucleotide 5'-hydroxyl-kinase [Anaerolineales bacterium]